MPRRRRIRLTETIPFPVFFIGMPILLIVLGAIPWIIGWNAARRPPIEAVPVNLTLPPGTSLSQLKSAEVTEVVDGDTIDVKLDGKLTRIRYFGVDTPERGQRCYREAIDRNKMLVGTTVLLLPDGRDKDRYDRTLRYIFTPDGTSIDATLVAEGFGRAWRDDGRYRDQIIALEDEAQHADRGCLWK